MTAYVTMKEMHTDLKKVQKLIDEGKEVVVMKHSKPIWNITPFVLEGKHKYESHWGEKYTIDDLEKFMFEGDPKNGDNLAEMIDKYVYYG